jgi:hypothetical protein
MAPHQFTWRRASIQRIRKQRMPRVQHVWRIADRMLKKVRRDCQMMHRAKHRRSLRLEGKQRLEARATLGAGSLFGAALRTRRQYVAASRHEG